MGMRRYSFRIKKKITSKDNSAHKQNYANFMAPKYSTKQMHLLLKNAIKALFAISEFEAKGKFTTFALAAGGAKSHYLPHSQYRHRSFLDIPSRQSTVLVLSPESR